MRRQQTVSDGTVSIVTIVDEAHQGPSPSLVMLPSSSRDSEDFDDIAECFARGGFRVLRPQPRGMCGSTGPMDGPDAARLCPRRRRGDRAAGWRLGLCPRAMRFGQWIGALRGGRSSEPGARRDPGRGGGEIGRSRAARRTGEMRRYLAAGRRCGWPRCRSPSSRRATIRRPGSATGIRWPPKASAPPVRRRRRTIGGPPVPRRCWTFRPNSIPGGRPTHATASATTSAPTGSPWWSSLTPAMR